jgi:hypothetical protein
MILSSAVLNFSLYFPKQLALYRLFFSLRLEEKAPRLTLRVILRPEQFERCWSCCREID